MKRAEALKRGLPILGIFRSFAAVGVDPAVMGIGPAVAIPAALAKAGLTTDDIDLYELNEAFASQVCARAPLTLHQRVAFRAQMPGTSTQMSDRVDSARHHACLARHKRGADTVAVLCLSHFHW